MGNCVRFFDDTTLEEVDRLDLDPFEMILSMVSATLTVGQGEASAGEGDGSKRRVSRPYIIIGTAYAYPDEDEPTKGRVLLIQCGEVAAEMAMPPATILPWSTQPPKEARCQARSTGPFALRRS